MRPCSLVTMILAGALLVTGTALADRTGDDKPTILDPAEASRLVLAEFPNARILELELDREHGQLVYEVELVTAEGKKKEVHINAVTGRLEKVEDD